MVRKGTGAAHFVNGRLTADGAAHEVKNSLQMERTGPGLTDLDQAILAAGRRDLFQSCAFARRILLPLFNRYEPGMQYGAHVDSVIMGTGAE
jgi:PKHD-type hydroxylase